MTDIVDDVSEVQARVTGLKAASSYIARHCGIPWFEDVSALKDCINRGMGPTIDQAIDGVPVYAKRDLDAWAIFTFGPDDDAVKRTMLDLYFNGDGSGTYELCWVPSIAQVDLVYFPDEELSEEQLAHIAAERDRTDPVVD